MLKPRLLEEARNAGYESLVDEATVSGALATSFSDAELRQLFTPATASLAAWLNSKQPDASFSVDARRQFDALTTQLSERLSAKMMALPACGFRNTMADIAQGVCRPPFSTQDELKAEIADTLRAQPLVKEGTLTSEQLALPDSLIARTRNLPEYLTMLYSAAIFAAGVLLIGALWVLWKHRFAGLIVIGLAGLIAAASLLAVQNNLLAAVNSLALATGYQAVARAVAGTIGSELFSLLAPLAGISAVVALVGAVGTYLMQRQHSKGEMHLKRQR